MGEPGDNPQWDKSGSGGKGGGVGAGLEAWILLAAIQADTPRKVSRLTVEF